MEFQDLNNIEWEEVPPMERSGYYGITLSTGTFKGGHRFLRLNINAELLQEASWENIKRVKVLTYLDKSDPANPKRLLKITGDPTLTPKMGYELKTALKGTKTLKIMGQDWILPYAIKDKSVKHEVHGAHKVIIVFLPPDFAKTQAAQPSTQEEVREKAPDSPVVYSQTPEVKRPLPPVETSKPRQGKPSTTVVKSLAELGRPGKSDAVYRILSNVKFSALNPSFQNSILTVDSKRVKIDPPVWENSLDILVNGQLNGKLSTIETIRNTLISSGFPPQTLNSISDKELVGMFNEFLKPLGVILKRDLEYDLLFISAE